MIDRLLVATRNEGKLQELSRLLFSFPAPLLSLGDVGIEEEVEETGSTLEENAVLKATVYARLSGLPTLADDSGLEVDALDGAPGPLSSRYAGEGAGDAERIAFLLDRLHNIPEERWTARFRCVIAVSLPGGACGAAHGRVPGPVWSGSRRGSNGFGYDPIFLLPEMGRTMAELTD